MRFMPDLSLIRGLEERAANAWPALETTLMDGWVLRLAQGVSKRTNAVSPYTPMPRPAEAVVPPAEEIFACRGLATLVRMSPLGLHGDERWLARRGYAPFEETSVMNVRLDDAPEPDEAIELSAAPTPDWIARSAVVGRWGLSSQPVVERMLSLIRYPAAFATLTVDGHVMGQGFCVVERGLVGLFDIQVVPSARGRGLGRRLTRALMGWGRENGAHFAYLQAAVENGPAQSLYQRLGFEEAYRYVYWKR